MSLSLSGECAPGAFSVSTCYLGSAMALVQEEGLHRALRVGKNGISKGGRRGTPDKVRLERGHESGVLWGQEAAT